MRILLTGFEPFGGASINPSVQMIAGVEICTAQLPVDAEKSPRVLLDAVQASRPDAVLCLGEAFGRAVAACLAKIQPSILAQP